MSTGGHKRASVHITRTQLSRAVCIVTAPVFAQLSVTRAAVAAQRRADFSERKDTESVSVLNEP